MLHSHEILHLNQIMFLLARSLIQNLVTFHFLSSPSSFRTNFFFQLFLLLFSTCNNFVHVSSFPFQTRTGNSNPGVLVTVQATRTVNNPMEQHHDNKLSVMGIVADELQEIMEFFNPSKFSH